MIDSSRPTVLTTGAAAAAATAAPQVSAQAPQAATPHGLPAGAKVGFYEKGDVRIRYAEIGSGFPLLATPGGGLNSRIINWPTMAVINIMEEFKNDFRVITMDQRNANNGESTGPVAVDNPWDAFADDQLGVMDHLGIRQFFFFGNCIGGPFAMKLMERAPQRVVAAMLSQPVGHRPDHAGLHVRFRQGCLGQGVRRPPDRCVDGDHREVSAQPLPRAARLRVQRVARLREIVPDADAGAARRRRRRIRCRSRSISLRWRRMPRSRCFPGRSRRS